MKIISRVDRRLPGLFHLAAFSLLPLACAFSGACAGQLATPTEADAVFAAERWPGTSLASLIEGRALYIDHCSSCHKLYRPAERLATTWPATVDEMTDHAKLTRADAELVKRYLVSAATPDVTTDTVPGLGAPTAPHP